MKENKEYHLMKFSIKESFINPNTFRSFLVKIRVYLTTIFINIGNTECDNLRLV